MLSLGNDDPSNEVSYTCKTDQGYIKDIIHTSDNSFVYAHQLHPVNVSPDYFKVTLKPTTIVPDFQVR